MSRDGSKDEYFTDEMKRTLVGDFVVQFYNKKLTLDLKRKVKGSDVYQVMTPEEFNKLKDVEVISYSAESHQAQTYPYTKWTTYDVYRRDDRFLVLEELVDKLSDVVEVPEDEKENVREKLYGLIMVMMREGRCPPEFKLQPYRDAQVANLASQVDKIARLLDALEKRVKSVENNPFLRTGISK